MRVGLSGSVEGLQSPVTVMSTIGGCRLTCLEELAVLGTETSRSFDPESAHARRVDGTPLT